MIFSEDAPELEQTLHRAFDGNRVNLVNRRKEFFAVSLSEIEAVAQEFGTIEFTLTAEAEQYRKNSCITRSWKHFCRAYARNPNSSTGAN